MWHWLIAIIYQNKRKSLREEEKGKERRKEGEKEGERGKGAVRERESHHLVDHSNPAPAKPTASEGWAGAETGSPGFLSGLSGHGRRKVAWSHQLQVHILSSGTHLRLGRRF